jgi:hypothetical protein
MCRSRNVRIIEKERQDGREKKERRKDSKNAKQK